MTDKESQEDELTALQSIFNDQELEIFRDKEELAGVFHAHINPEKKVKIIYRDKRKKDRAVLDMLLQHLPPVNLHFSLPRNYPSQSPPQFTLSSKWLPRPKITKLCEKLDSLWDENKGSEILFVWINFLKEDSLKFLDIEGVLDLSSMYTYNLRYMEKINKKMNVPVTKANKDQESLPKQEEKIVQCEAKNFTVNNIDEKGRGRGRGRTSHNKKEWISNDSFSFGRRISNSSYQNAPHYKLEVLQQSASTSNNSSIQDNATPVNSVFKECQKKKTSRYTRNRELPLPPLDSRAVLDLPPTESVIQVLIDHNEKSEKEEFDHGFFTCHICFEEKIGAKCTLFNACKHVYCRDCIREYFHFKISDGSVRNITCPSDKCNSEALPSQVRELVTPEMFERYDSILLSLTLDTMLDIVYCPRRFCQYPVSRDADENMASCPSCGFVFCIHCKKVYHGVAACTINPSELNKLLSEYSNASVADKERLEVRYGKKRLQDLLDTSRTENWIANYSRNCPNCRVSIEKAEGCNKMVCWFCNKMFCWICGIILESSNPYRHFGDRNSKCYNKLFQGMVVGNNDEMDNFVMMAVEDEENDEDDDW